MRGSQILDFVGYNKFLFLILGINHNKNKMTKTNQIKNSICYNWVHYNRVWLYFDIIGVNKISTYFFVFSESNPTWMITAVQCRTRWTSFPSCSRVDPMSYPELNLIRWRHWRPLKLITPLHCIGIFFAADNLVISILGSFKWVT